MYLNTNLSALQAENSLQGTMGGLGTTEQQIATGNALANPATDPAAGMITTLSQGQLGAMSQASRNVAQGIALLNTANGAVQGDIQIVQQMQQLAVQASNGTNTPQDRADLQAQVQALAKQIDQNGQVQYNGLSIFAPPSTAPSWKAVPWPSTTVEDAMGGQYGSFSALSGNLPSTSGGTPVEYVAQAYLNVIPSDAMSHVGITVIGYPATVAGTNAGYENFGPYATSYEGDGPHAGPAFYLSQVAATVPASGTFTVSSASTSADHGAFSVVATGVSGPPITFTIHYRATPTGQGAYEAASIFGYSPGGVSTALGTGTASGLDLQIGGRNVQANRMPLHLPTLTASSLGLASVALDTPTATANAITGIQAALSHLTNVQAGIGAQLDQLQAQAGNLATGQTQAAVGQAALGDTNLASATSQAARQQILMQTGMAALVQANQQPHAILSLLQSV